MEPREIKFRVWDGKQMIVESNIQATPYCLVIYLNGKIVDIGNERDEEKLFTILQFTGQKDRNSKEIYDGGILKGEKIIHYVIIDESGTWLLNRNYNANHPNPYTKRLYPNNLYMEVIGNIYENPELLPKEKP